MYEMGGLDRSTFVLFSRWLYTQKLIHDDVPETPPGCSKSDAIVKLWVLAEKLLIPRLQNLAMRLLAECWCDGTGWEPSLFSIRYIYDNTECDSHLRKAAVDFCAISSRKTIFTIYGHILPHEMLLDLAIRLRRFLYHEKPDGPSLEDFYVKED